MNSPACSCVSITGRVAAAEHSLRGGVASLCELPPQSDCFDRVLLDALSMQKLPREIVLSLGVILIGGLPKPLHCLSIVWGNSKSEHCAVCAAQPVLRVGVSLFRRLAKPLHCLPFVAVHADTKVVKRANGVLRFGIALIGGCMKKTRCRLHVCRHASLCEIGNSEASQRCRITGLGSEKLGCEIVVK